jgi:hypothetical protein
MKSTDIAYLSDNTTELWQKYGLTRKTGTILKNVWLFRSAENRSHFLSPFARGMIGGIPNKACFLRSLPPPLSLPLVKGEKNCPFFQNRSGKGDFRKFAKVQYFSHSKYLRHFKYVMLEIYGSVTVDGQNEKTRVSFRASVDAQGDPKGTFRLTRFE